MEKQTHPHFRPIVIGVLLLLALSLPVALADLAIEKPFVLTPLVSSLAWLALLWALLGLTAATGRAAFIALCLTVLVLLLIRLGYFGLIRFSGFGYTPEFFLHLERESVEVAWKEYPLLIIFAAATLVLSLIGLLWSGTTIPKIPNQLAAGIALLAAIALILMRPALPEWQLISGWQAWRQPPPPPLTEQQMQRWEASDLVETDLISKAALTAQPPEQPRNLILLYLESVGVALTEHPEWPQLMPRTRSLIEQYALVDTFHTSSYITIEGIVNSQCATLFPFDRGSESLAGADGLAERMTCLGDVLRTAGFQQTYLGGASMNFAGKGSFLTSHGYDTVKGMEHWRSLGMSQRRGTWGLSDADLFEQSLLEIDALRQESRPFNLTMLTIGTHLPGYSYEECQPYPHSDERFLNALHCTDQLLGNWLDRLRDTGVLTNTVVVITADHHVFPNPEMRRLFGEDAVYDRRLPLIVISPDQPPQSAESGALYDLAPTVLQLLDIEHNATFALGRGLLDAPERNYYLSRYAHIHQGEALRHLDPNCDPETKDPVSLPLSVCDSAQLQTLLYGQIEALSLRQGVMDCQAPHRNILSSPADAKQPVSVKVGGVEQVDRFTWRSRPIDASAPGLFLLRLNDQAKVLERQFVPAASVADRLADAPDISQGETVIALWRSNGEDSAPDWLDSQNPGDAGLWHKGHASGERWQRLAEPGSNGDLHWQADQAFCRSLMN